MITENSEINAKIERLWHLMDEARKLNREIFESLTEEDLEKTWHSVSTRIKEQTEHSHAESATNATVGE